MSSINTVGTHGGVKQSSASPTRKVIAGGVASAVSTIVVYLVDTYVHPSGTPLPHEVTAALIPIVTFIVSYLVPPAASDQITRA